MSSTGKQIQAGSDNTKELVTAINLMAGEVATFKESINNTVKDLNGTLGLTNRNVRELKESINESTKNMIDSSQKLSDSQNRYSLGMFALTLLLVIVGICQIIVMVKQANIMSAQSIIMQNQAEEAKQRVEFELLPVVEIEAQGAGYVDNNLTFYYALLNRKSKILNITRCHTLDLINKQTGDVKSMKQETCVSNEHDHMLLPDRSSLIHADQIGEYKIKTPEPAQYFRINLKIDYQTEEILGKKCLVSRSFELFPKEGGFIFRPLSYTKATCN